MFGDSLTDYFPMDKLKDIDAEIKTLCEENKFEYVDVFDKLIGEEGQLSREYTVDGIHLQENAYDVVSLLIHQILEK